jgi:succinoglycan biosynthesis protein ExoM
VHVVVAVATYKRPNQLAELLTSFTAEQGPYAFEVVVVDNDAAGSAEGIVSSFDLPLSYVREPRPGIAAARNAALNVITETATHLLFVDDDEVVPPRWIQTLVEAAKKYNAEIACGPVRSVFPSDAPGWIERGGYIQRSPDVEGLTSRTPATNNTLVAITCLERAGFPRFDEGFSATGGSDTDFFTRLIAASGARVVWVPSAEVWEEVPRDRLTFRWVMRRYIRINNVSGRIMLRTTSAPRLAGKAVWHIAVGTGRTAAAILTGKGLRLKDTAQITRGIGWLGAISGRHVQEYQRSTGR